MSGDCIETKLVLTNIQRNGLIYSSSGMFLGHLNKEVKFEDIPEHTEPPYEPYFGWCDVEGCEEEASSGGCAWSETGHWCVCSKHLCESEENVLQPKMKQKAIDRENSRDKVTGYLPSVKI